MTRPRRISDEIAVPEGDGAAVELPRAPTLEQWAALSERQREKVLRELDTALEQEALGNAVRFGEGDLHSDGINRVRDVLRRFFRSVDRRIYVGTNLNVIYPGEAPFVPDVLAVLNVEPHPRNRWLVHHEGKGPDWGLEVFNRGDWHKDSVTNVSRYAGLGIPEYFLYDVSRQRVLGWRLPKLEAREYTSLAPGPFGQLSSAVLGLDLVVTGGRLRFYQGSARLLDADDLIQELNARVAEAEQQKAEAEQQKAEAEQQKAEAEQRVRVQVLLGLLESRGLPVTQAQRQQITTAEAPQLDGWIGRAALVDSIEDLLGASTSGD